jgi:O-antigen/teichoic acid export membrane protein
MASAIKIDGKILTKNWGLNLSGQVLPLIVALAAMPFIVRGLGPERFGVLSIVWAVLGSLTLLDLGLGRSTTKFVAECLGRGDVQKFPGLFWTSLWSQLLIGIVGSLLMAALVPHLVDRYLKLSVANAEETKSSFLILAASFPVVLGGNSIRGVLEAAQRFDVVNYVRIPVMTCMFLFPAIALPFGLRLPAIVFLLVLSRLGAALTYLVVCLRLFPSVRRNYSLDYKLLRPLLAYGGWVSISNFVAPLLAYADRFVVGSVLGMSYVSYYTAPNEAITKASVLPGTLLTTLFPALASLDASGARARVQELCARAIKSLLLLMTPSLLIVFVFARQILQLWLGTDFATRSAGVLQIFCVGILVNSLAFVPFFLLQGLGRPDVTAKIHIIELPIYALALAILLPRMGLTGAALAWSFRLFLDACLLFGAASWLKLLSVRAILDSYVRRAFLLLCGLGAAFILPFLANGRLSAQLLFVGAALLAFVFAVWKYVFDAKDKSLFLSTSLQIRAAMGRSK